MGNYHGSRKLVVGAHYGLRDWLSQRVTAALMVLFTIVLGVQLLMPGELGYERPNGNAVGLLVAHGGDIASEPLGVTCLDLALRFGLHQVSLGRDSDAPRHKPYPK